MTEELNIQVTDPNPTADGLSADQAVQTPAEAATPEPSPEEVALTELENAAPEERPAKREGLQKRISEITSKRREAEDRARTLELENARLQGRLEATGPQQAPPQQVQEPVIPAPQMPSKPAKEAFFKKPDEWSDPELDQEAYLEAVAEWKADCKFIERDHRQTVERIKVDNQRNQQQAQTLVNEINQAHPGFIDKMRLYPISQAVGESIGILANIDKKAAIDTANYLVNNPAELQRLGAMHPDQAKIAFAVLAKSLPASPPPKTTTNAVPPITPVTPAAPTADVSINTASDYIAEMDRKEFGT